jgi:hypothetical protein
MLWDLIMPVLKRILVHFWVRTKTTAYIKMRSLLKWINLTNKFPGQEAYQESDSIIWLRFILLIRRLKIIREPQWLIMDSMGTRDLLCRPHISWISQVSDNPRVETLRSLILRLLLLILISLMMRTLFQTFRAQIKDLTLIDCLIIE